MSFSISSLFNGGATPAPKSDVAAPTAPAPVQVTPSTPGNIPTVQQNITLPTDAAPIDSPLEPFKNLWDPVVNKEPQNATPTALDPAKLQELVSKANFSGGISKENLAKIAQGGEEAQQAFTESMNAVAQQVMVQALLASNKITEQAVDKVNKAWETKLPEMLRKQTLSETQRDSNPIYSNPAIKPVMEAVQSQLAAKYPNATSNELSVMTNNFVKAMGEAFNPAQANSGKSKEASFNWEKFLTSPEDN